MTKAQKEIFFQKIQDCMNDPEANSKDYHWSMVFEEFVNNPSAMKNSAPVWWPYSMRKLAQFLRTV